MAMFDSVRRAFGMRVESDVKEAREAVDVIRDAGVEGRFAARLAPEMAKLSNAHLRRALPSMTTDVAGPIPGAKQPEMRELHIAMGLHAFAKDYVERGASGSMGPEIGREVRREGLSRLVESSLAFRAEDVLSRPLHAVVDEGSKSVEDNTRAYLGVGARNEMAMMAAANTMDAFGRAPEGEPGMKTSDVLARGVAMARAGLISPRRVVQDANRSEVVQAMKKERVLEHVPGQPDMITIVPDFVKGRANARDADLRQKAIERSRTSMTRIVPATHAKVDRTAGAARTEDLAVPMPTRRASAAMSAAMSQGTGR